jgi:hypothetical protein
MEWAYRVFAVVVVMVGPGLAGNWLDRRWGTGFLALVGFALGLTAGVAYLIAMTKSKRGDEPPGRL